MIISLENRPTHGKSRHNRIIIATDTVDGSFSGLLQDSACTLPSWYVPRAGCNYTQNAVNTRRMDGDTIYGHHDKVYNNYKVHA